MAMIFLTNNDLETRVFENYIDDSVQEDLDALDRIELQGIATIKSKLRTRYDVDVIFSNADYEGKPLIIDALSAIVVYRMIKRNAARKVPSDFEQAYNEAMQWLKDVRDGNENPELPLLEVPLRPEVLWGNSSNEDNRY